MAVFEYTALSTKGRKLKGLVDADSAKTARLKLKAQGIFPTSLLERQRQPLSVTKQPLAWLLERKVSTAQLSIATRQLATLVSAGIPLVEAIKALKEQLEQPRLKTVFSEVCDRITEGSSFANALQNYPKVFPPLYANMVKSGEASGTLDLVMERLADLLEAQVQLHRKILSAIAYPVLMLLLCLGVVVLLLTYVVPQLTEIFEDRDAALPLPTQIVVVLSDFVRSYWWAILAMIVFGITAFKKYALTTKGRRQIDNFKLRSRIFGPFTKKIASAQFSRTLGTMLSSGVELITALTIVKNILGNVVIQQTLDGIILGVSEGKSLANQLDQTKVFPRLLVHMTAIGEKTGQLENMLIRAAQSYESEMNSIVTSLTAILNPILILFLALLVGFILIAVMLPMLEMTSLAG
ncbi:MAG: type II secretion system inner membrane protein GspF [Deltaproteobacteria bacterium]|nr:type II secretion system inner membrane protein GspF [Deltaproteobacteria bacterium]